MWWTWSVAAVVTLATVGVIRTSDSVAPLSGPGSHTPYVDTPYHLALVAALSKRAPTDLPFLKGEPLYYHWFFHAHVANVGHATGVELVVLLTRLCLVPMIVLIVLGAALLTQRLSGSALAGLGAAVLLVLASGAPVSPAFTGTLEPTVAVLSPTTTYAQALLVGVVALSVHLLAARRTTWGEWLCAGALLVAVSGAKSTMLPIVIGGYVAVLVMRLFTRRPLPRPVFGLLGIAVVVELLAQRLVYGGSSQGTTLHFLGIAGHLADNLGLVRHPRDASLSLVLLLSLVFVVCALAYGAGILGLFTRDHWRDPRAQFLVGAALAGLGGTLAFDNEVGSNQIYFLRVTPLLFTVAGAWGLSVLVARVPRRLVWRIGGACFVGGVALAAVMRLLRPDTLARMPDHPPEQLTVLVPTLILIVAVTVVALVFGLRSRGRGDLVGVAPLACIALLLGMCVPAAATLRVHAFDETVLSTLKGHDDWQPTIGMGGIQAARWLRDHSDPDAIVATNAHCRIPNGHPCDHRTTWISGFTERQMLIEGWSYTSRTDTEGKKQGHTTPYVDYWKPRVLADNDRVFQHPTKAAVARLHDHYGVDWLFADKRAGVDMAGLQRVAKLRYRNGSYAVFEID